MKKLGLCCRQRRVRGSGRRFGSAAGNVRHHIYYNADKPGGVRLDLLDNTGDRFDYFRFDKSSGLIASEAPLRLVWRVRTVGALARLSSDRFAHVLWRSRCAPRRLLSDRSHALIVYRARVCARYLISGVPVLHDVSIWC